MARFASVVRTEEGLREGLRRLGKIRREGVLPDEMGVVFSLETENLLDVAEMVLRACLMRKESRGPHLRFSRIEDEAPLPSRDPEWRRFVVIQNEEGRMVLKKRRPVALSETLG
jgi:succinate dehydrogenase / fumarate reductase flavoprotein subunit